MLTALKEWWGEIKEKGVTKAGAIVFLFLGIGAALFQSYFRPQWEKLNFLRRELSEVQAAVEQAQQQGWDNTPGLQAKIDDLRRQQEELYGVVPRIKDVPGLIATLYELICRYQLEVPKGVVFSNLQEYPEGYATFDASLTVIGKNADVYEFISAVENLPRQVEVAKSLLVAEGQDKLRGELVLRVFVLEEIKPDPDYYPFMEFKKIEQKPYSIFQPAAIAGDLAAAENELKEAQEDKAKEQRIAEATASAFAAAKGAEGTQQEIEEVKSEKSFSSTATYEVKKGDTLQSIAKKNFGNSQLWPLLAEINHLQPPYILRPGDVILLPENTYAVQPGDTLQSIAKKIYGTVNRWEDLARANYISYPYRLYAGQKLVLP